MKRLNSRLINTLLYIMAFFVCVYCTKDEHQTHTAADKEILSRNQSGAVMLPINLSEYNILNIAPGDAIQTKGAANNDFLFVADSLINWRKACQESSPNGIVYTQIPFKMNDSSILGALSFSEKNLKEAIVPIKCFYIIFEDCIQQLRAEYIVTMIPSKTQIAMRPDYDYLNKPNFDGIILYSSKEGNYVKIDMFTNGLIEQGRLLTPQESDTLHKTYIGFYTEALVRSKSDFPMQYLDEIVVTGVKEPRELIIPDFTTPDRKFEEVVKEVAPKPPGGGTPPSSSNSKKEYTLTFIEGGCRSQLIKSERYSALSEVSLSAPAGSDNCIFLCWAENGFYLSNSTNLKVLMDKDKTILAQYVSKENKDCYNLARFANDTVLMKKITGVRGKTKQNNIEYGFSKKDDGGYVEHKGKSGSLTFRYEPGVKYLSHFHSHNGGNIFTSAADLMSLRNWALNDKMINISQFTYGVITEDKILCLKIYDRTKFINYFNNLSTNETELKTEFNESYKNSFLNFIQKLNEPDLYQLYVRQMDNMGISVFRGNSFEGEFNTVVTKWYSLTIDANTSSYNINDCLR